MARQRVGFSSIALALAERWPFTRDARHRQGYPPQNVAPPPVIIYPAIAAQNTPPQVIASPPKFIGVGPMGYVAYQTAPALTAVSSFWGALSLGWFAVAFARQAKDRRVLIIGGLIWGAVMLPFIGLLLWHNGLGVLGFALLLWFWPVLHYASLADPYRNPLPHYTNAIVKMKLGKYAEAEQAIIQELEKCENDFQGWLMLAELYARQFGDLAEAEKTMLDLCNEPATTVSQVSVALHKLADWQLQYREDPVAARRALEEIVRRMPGTHLATMAKHRICQLPATKEEFVEARARKFKMPALSDELHGEAGEIISEANPREAEVAANQCVEKLKRDPNDTAVREKLARIFAERLGQPALAINQLELLAEMPGQPPGKMAEWLGLMAAWQIKYRHDPEAAQKLLRRLIKDFPQSAQAFAAQRRLKLMEMR